jgi:hypothetical protein
VTAGVDDRGGESEGASLGLGPDGLEERERLRERRMPLLDESVHGAILRARRVDGL